MDFGPYSNQLVSDYADVIDAIDRLFRWGEDPVVIEFRRHIIHRYLDLIADRDRPFDHDGASSTS